MGSASTTRISGLLKRLTGAHRADETVDPLSGLAPDFRSGGLKMGAAVGDIVPLVGP